MHLVLILENIQSLKMNVIYMTFVMLKIYKS